MFVNFLLRHLRFQDFTPTFFTSMTRGRRSSVATIPAGRGGCCGRAYRRLPTVQRRGRQNAEVSAAATMPTMTAAVGCDVYRAADHRTAPGAVESVPTNTEAADHGPGIHRSSMHKFINHHQNNLLWRHSTGAQQRLINSTVHTM